MIVRYPDGLPVSRDESLTVRGHMLHAINVVPTLIDYSTTGLACFAACDIASGEGRSSEAAATCCTRH
jgi:hypothetical protein